MSLNLGTMSAAVTLDVSQYQRNLSTLENESACIETVEGEGGAVDRYIEWQAGAIGRDINPDKLRAFVLAPDWEGAVGAYRIDVVAPGFKALGPTEIAKFNGTKTIKHEVVEE